jgi:GNAT superfamily N-acetyltransferase
VWGRPYRQSFRRLWPVELPAFCDHLIRLDLEAVTPPDCHGHFRRFPEPIRGTVFGNNDLIYGYFAEGKMRAAEEFRGFDSPHNGKRRAEAAFSVEKSFQRDGIGSELVRRIVRAAGNRRISILLMTCRAQNLALHNLVALHDRNMRRAPRCAGASAHLVVERGCSRHGLSFTTMASDLRT